MISKIKIGLRISAILASLVILILVSGLGCKSSGGEEALKPITLNYWGVWSSGDDFSEIINAYKTLHPNISVNYRKLKYEEYEQALIEAWARDQGPDIFSIANTWTRKYQEFIEPLPPEIKTTYGEIKGGCKKQKAISLKTTASLSVSKLKENFVDVVGQDVVLKDESQKEAVYGLPLAMDTLVLYYNKDLLNSAHIAQPATTWQEAVDQVKKLTLQDSQGAIVQSGIALGTADNIPRATDALSILMMQNGTQMTDSPETQATFNLESKETKGYYPGERALEFYTDFANPAKEVYTWNSEISSGLDAFSEGKLAFLLGYQYQLATIRAKNPKLNFEIAKLPQVGQEVNFANYWLETVAKKTKYPNEAWDFVQFAASADQVAKYLNKTQKTTALRALLKAQEEDPDLDVFVSQALTAKSWYHGKNPGMVEKYLKEMIDNFSSGKATSKEAINIAIGQINQTY